MTLIFRQHCFQALFSDRTGATCLLSDSVMNRAVIVLGVHQHAMVLGAHEVRELLPHLQRFVEAGRLAPDEGEDWQI
jgi:hypothetical protein